jgi:aminopeptidase N
MTRDAEMAASDFVELVLRGVGAESDLTAVHTLTRQAQAAVNTYVAPQRRSKVRQSWEHGLLDLLKRAEPGSDHQLAFLRALAATVTGDATTDFLAGLLDGSVTLDGLTVDTDLRWVLVTGLAAVGRVDEPAIEAERSRDNTISGQQQAAAARTAIPSPEAKEWAWHNATEREDVPNETQRNIAASFQRAGQDELLMPYVDRYLDLARTVWEARGTQMASNILMLMFPRALATPEVLDSGPAARVGGVRRPRARAARAGARRRLSCPS